MNFQFSRASLAAIILTSVFSSIHHLYRFGISWIGYALALVLIPYLLMYWFRRRGNRIVLFLYGLFNALIVIWLGIVDGFLDHTLKALNPEWGIHILPEFRGDFFYEMTGVATFVASVFAVYYGYKFVRRATQ